MLYIYDILLNFSKEKLLEFYEWEKDDKIDHVKKIKLLKIDSKVMDDFIDYTVTILDEKKEEIKNGMELFKNKQIKSAMLFTDGYRVLAILFNEQYKSIAKSKLLLEEELDVLDIAEKLNTVNMVYKKTAKKNLLFLTRREFEIKCYLEKELKKAYKKQDINKLTYIYMEYFDGEEKDFEKMYIQLKNSLQEINEKHIKIFDMLTCNRNKQIN